MTHLMIVDDEAVFRRGLMSCINWAQHGIEVVAEAGNGKEAIQLIRALKPDVVLLDVKMPMLDGVEVVRTISTEMPDVRFIMLSCMNDLEYVRDSMKLGARDYLFKPVAMPEDILRAIKEVLPSEVPNGVSMNTSAVEKVVNYIERNYAKEISLDDLARIACLSKNYFCSIFNQEINQTPMEYLTAYRIQVAQQLIHSTNMSLSDIANAIGIADYARFCKTFKRITGDSPGAYKRGRK